MLHLQAHDFIKLHSRPYIIGILCVSYIHIPNTHIYGCQILFIYATSLLYVLNVKSLSGQMRICNVFAS